MSDALATVPPAPLEQALSRELALDTALAGLLEALGLSDAWTEGRFKSIERAMLFVSASVPAASSQPAIARALVVARATLDGVRRTREAAR